MHLDQESVGSGCDRCETHRHHEAAHAGAMRRIDHDREMGQRPQQRHRRQVEQVARLLVVGPDAAFAQHDLVVPRDVDVFGSHQPLFDRCRDAPFKQHRLARAAHLAQEPEVLHVAGPDLQHVGVALDQLDVAHVEHLRHDGQAGAVRRRAHDLEALLAQPLKGIGRGPRLERAAAQEVCAGPRDRVCRQVELLARFDAARSARDRELLSPEADAVAHAHDGTLGARLPADKLVAVGDRDDRVDALELGELGEQDLLVFDRADDADDRALRAAAHVRGQLQRSDQGGDGI